MALGARLAHTFFVAGARAASAVPDLRSLLEDHLRLDFWPLLEELDADAIHFVFGGRSPVIPKDLPERIAGIGGEVPVSVHVLRSAGHRVHVDDSDGLLRLFGENLP